MKDLLIAQTTDSPAVLLRKTGELSIKGDSYPEDSLKFYSPILNWLIEYCDNPADKTVLTFNMSYFNSSSSMPLLKILSTLEALHKAGHPVQVIWLHEAGDDLMVERAEEMSSLVDLPFEIREE